MHPGNGELIAATHGRSLWITDVSWLRQIRPEHLTSDVVLYQPSEVIRWHREPSRGSTNRRFVGQNPSNDAQIYYVLPENAQNVTLRVLDVEGNVLRELRASKEPGLNRVVWDLTRTRNERPAGAPSGRSGGALGGRGRSQERPPMSGGQQERPTEQAREQPREASQQPASQTEPPEEQRPSPMRSGIGRGGFGAAGRGGFAFGQAARPVPAGTYRLVLSVDGRDVQRTIVIRNDPSAPADALTADSELYWESLEVENEEQEELWREEWGGEAELDEAPDTWID